MEFCVIAGGNARAHWASVHVMGRPEDTHIGMCVDVKVFRHRPSKSIVPPGTFGSTDFPEVRPPNVGTVAHHLSQMAIRLSMIGAIVKRHPSCSPDRRDRCRWLALRLRSPRTEASRLPLPRRSRRLAFEHHALCSGSSIRLI
jgi:hypothetical protein